MFSCATRIRSFNFDEKSEQYDGNASLDQPVGGIGLFLVKKFVDEVKYEPGTTEGNRVSFVKRLK